MAKNRVMVVLAVVAVVFALSATVRVLAPPLARAEHGWGQHLPYRELRVRLELVDVAAPLARALEDWSAVGLTFRVRVVAGGKQCRGSDVLAVRDGVIRVCSAADGIAWATVDQVVEGHYHAGIVGVAPTVTGRRFRRYVLCHEVGHVLGLDHNLGEPESCMSHTGWPRPSEHDLEELRQAYAHTD